jgi:hypothetical protein
MAYGEVEFEHAFLFAGKSTPAGRSGRRDAIEKIEFLPRVEIKCGHRLNSTPLCRLSHPDAEAFSPYSVHTPLLHKRVPQSCV